MDAKGRSNLTLAGHFTVLLLDLRVLLDLRGLVSVVPCPFDATNVAQKPKRTLKASLRRPSRHP